MTASPMTGAAIAPDVPVAEEPPVPVEETPEDRKRRRRRAFLLFFLLALLALLVLLATWYLLFRQPLPIIPPIPDAKLPGYSTSLYGASSPTGVAVTPSGDRIYVAETGGDYTVRIFDGGGSLVGTMALPDDGADHVPVYVAIDPLTAEVYVSDRPAGAIHIFDRDGQYQRPFSPAEPRPGWQPMGLAFDRAGNLYVTVLSGSAQTVQVFDRAGQLLRTIGADAGLDFPNGVAVDDAGNVWVTDSNNGRLLVFDQAGDTIARVGRGAGEGKLGLPRGLAIDSRGRVFVVDSTGNGVVLYRAALDADDRAPEYVGFVGGRGAADGQFAFPVGAAVDDRGRIYVADTANNRVQIWSY